MDELQKFNMEEIVTGMPGGFFIYRAEGREDVIYANNEVLYLYGCKNMNEFRELTGKTFPGMVHQDDVDEVEESIARQIAASPRNMDYVEYRIVRKDGEIRWVEDFGHLVKNSPFGAAFYVFISDVTEKRERNNKKEKDYVDKLMDQELISKSLLLTSSIYREIYTVDLDEDFYRILYSDKQDVKMSGSYCEMVEERILSGELKSDPPEDIRKFLRAELIKEALMNTDSVEYQYSRRDKDGEMERCTTLIAVSSRKDGVPVSVVMGIRSIENLLQREERQNVIIENALLQAEQASGTKTQFLANMSHDIRTPMNVIMGFTDLALSHPDDREQVVNSLKKIKTSSEILLELIDNLLDMTRIDAGGMVLEEKECSLIRILKEVRINYSDRMEAKGIICEIDVKELTHPFVFCDETKLKQMFGYVIDNAVKFNWQGGRINISAHQTASLGSRIAYYEFKIADTGIGIAPEFIDRIFLPFERERTSTVSKEKGSGLGLPIVKKIVELMNGTVDIISKAGEGTECVIKLPFQMVRPDREFKAEKSDADKSNTVKEEVTTRQNGLDRSLKGKRILLAEDNELNREIAKSLLEESGLIIDSAEDGDIAVQMLLDAKVPYDGIIMDIQMPHMDGYLTTKAIRELSDPVLSGIPIIGVSANAFEEDKRKSLEMGMNEHLPKPIDMELVLETLKKYI